MTAFGLWWTESCGDTPLKHLHAYVFYGLGKWIDSGYLSLGQAAGSNRLAYRTAANTLDLLIHGDNDTEIRLDESHSSAIVLKRVLDDILDLDPATVPSEELANRYRHAAGSFENALLLELGRAPIFYVVPQGVYSTRALVNDASVVFGALRSKLPQQALDDTMQAGRCLAFELSTAAGFHIARATEAVLKDYRLLFCGSSPVSKRDWGHAIDALEKSPETDKRVVNALNQLRTLHRNPLIHPEETLTVVEAQSLWALCCSAIQAMVIEMERKKGTPTSAAVLPPVI